MNDFALAKLGLRDGRPSAADAPGGRWAGRSLEHSNSKVSRASAATVLRRVVRACALFSLPARGICNTQCFFSDFKLRHLCWIVVEEDAGTGT